MNLRCVLAYVATFISVSIPVAGNAQDVYKCIDAKGRVQFTDVPKAKLNCRELKLQVVTIGMTGDQAMKIMGVPDHVSFVENASGRSELWYYKTGLIITFDNGRVYQIEKQ